jgi:hypothetical protein
MNRDTLIQQGLLTPAEFYLALDKNDPRRVKYEHKLILLGIDPSCYPVNDLFEDPKPVIVGRA